MNLRTIQCLLSVTAALSVAAAVRADDYDLSGLSPYQDKDRIQGVIHISGNDMINLVKNWEVEFKRINPEVRFEDYLLTTPMAFAGLATGTSEIGYMGHSWWHLDMVGFEQTFGYPVLEIKYANGSFDAPIGSTEAPIFFVHKDNPLSGLTLDQLDGIYGAERTGGWEGTKWTTAAARGPEKNIRTWGQLGLKGDWANKPIHVYGLDGVLSNWSDMVEKRIFHGGTKWNPAIHEIVRGGVETPVDEKLVQAVIDDPLGISFTFMKVVNRMHANAQVRVLSLAAHAGGPYVMATKESVFGDTYPMNNGVYLYVNRPPGKPLPPRIKEFLTYVLSREGQAQVQQDGVWVPLNPRQAAVELAKLQ